MLAEAGSLTSRKRDREDDSHASTSRESQENESEYRPKKLRVIFRERSAVTLLEDAQKVTEADASLKFLQDFTQEFLRHLSPDECSIVGDKLIKLIRSKWAETEVQDAALSLLLTVLKDCQFSADELDSLLRQVFLLKPVISKPSNAYRKLLSLWRSWLPDWSRLATSKDLESLQQSAVEALELSDWNARVQGLQLLTGFALLHCGGDINSQAEEDRVGRQKLESCLGRFAGDQDPRVRAAAVRCLVQICLDAQDGWMLQPSTYPQVCNLLHDNAEDVRLNAMKLVRKFAASYPEEMVPGPNKGVELRLVDDAFSRLCNRMHDISVSVRQEAATLLGEINDAGDSFLAQTLDKKLMSKMRFLKSSSRGRADQLLQEWSTGKRLGEDIPVEKMEEDSLSLIPSGACGAFVTGLEDEFMAVRQASVRSLSCLAANRGDFAAKALDFLADMFNDEIEEVRLDAINCLRPLVRYSQLKEDQTEVVLNVLDDAMADSRSALRELLCSCQLATVGCLRMTVDALLNNLRRYPADKDSILGCMKSLGVNHPTLVQAMVNELLGLHPFFDTPEPQIDNAAYLAKLVLVLNGAAHCPPILSLFPDHTWRHYRYLRDSAPNLVTPLKAVSLHQVQPIVEISETKQEVATEEDVYSLLRSTHERLVLADSLQFQTREEIVALLTRDLSRIGELDERLSGCADLLQSCCALRSLLEKLTKLSVNDRGTGDGNLEEVTGLLDRALAAMSELTQLFTGSGLDTERFLIECRLRITVLLSTATTNAVEAATKENLNSLVETSLESFRQVVLSGPKFEDDRDMVLLRDLDDNSDDFKLMKDDPHDLAPRLTTKLSRVPLHLPRYLDVQSVVRKKCVITDPTDSDLVIRFVAGLVTSVSLTASLRDYNLRDLELIRVQVAYPDQREQLFRPRATDFRQISPTVFRLRTDVLLSASIWNDRAAVKITIVLLQTKDDSEVAKICAKIGGCSESGTHESSTPCGESITVLLFPKIKC